MGNLMTNIKKFLSNKNTVTILGVILGVVVLYIGYNYRVNQAIELVSVPYAVEAIGGKTKITSDMISTVEVNRSFLKNNPNVITDMNRLIDYYVNYGNPIPAGSFFYTDQVVEEKELNEKIEEQETDNEKEKKKTKKIDKEKDTEKKKATTKNIKKDKVQKIEYI